MTRRLITAALTITLAVLIQTAAFAGGVPKDVLQRWHERAPASRYPVVTDVVLSETIPRWGKPQHQLHFDRSIELKNPGNEAMAYPFPHGITFTCKLPYPSEIEVAYRPKGADDNSVKTLTELGTGKDRTSKMYKNGYYMIQWGKMAPDENGVIVGDVLVSIVPSEEWRGRADPGPTGAEGIEIFITDVSINPRYYQKKYKGPGQARSTPLVFTTMIGGTSLTR